MTDPEDEPIGLTGSTPRAKIRKTYIAETAYEVVCELTEPEDHLALPGHLYPQCILSVPVMTRPQPVQVDVDCGGFWRLPCSTVIGSLLPHFSVV